MSDGGVGLASGLVWLGANLLLHSSLIIGAALILARFVIRSAAARCAIYQATSAALAALPLVSMVFAAADVTLIRVALQPSPAASSGQEAGQFGDRADPLARNASQPAAAGMGLAPVGERISWQQDGPLAGVRQCPVRFVCTWLAAMWVIGAFGLLVGLANSHGALERVQERAQPCDTLGAYAGLADLARSVGVPMPMVLLSKEVRSPLLVGLVKPVILLPDGMWARRASEDLMAVFLHELGHLARRDQIALLLARLVCCILFFQPLVWLLLRRMEESADQVVDDIVLDGGAPAKGYAQNLWRWAALYFPSESESMAGVGVVRFRSALGRRVTRILDGARQLTTGVSLRAACSLGCALAAASLVVSLMAVAPPRVEAFEDDPQPAPLPWRRIPYERPYEGVQTSPPEEERETPSAAPRPGDDETPVPTGEGQVGHGPGPTLEEPAVPEEPDPEPAPGAPEPASPVPHTPEAAEPDHLGPAPLFSGHPFLGHGVQPVRIAELGWKAIRYASLDKDDQVKRFVHVFELAAPRDGFVIYPWRGDRGTVASLRLRDTAQDGRVIEFSLVAVARSPEGQWGVTDEARERLIGEIRERLYSQGAW